MLDIMIILLMQMHNFIMKHNLMLTHQLETFYYYFDAKGQFWLFFHKCLRQGLCHRDDIVVCLVYFVLHFDNVPLALYTSINTPFAVVHSH